jgi:3-methyladenine DNA glycosylase AlkC
MADPLKQMYNPQFFEHLCPVLREVIPLFDERAFINNIFTKDWPDLELKQRVRRITHALHNTMRAAAYGDAAKKIVAISNLLREKNVKLQSFPYIFLPDYIEIYGQRHFEISMSAIRDVTKLVSAEFAIRPFLINEPERTLSKLLHWSTNDDENIRRLSSEGCRPRLPWAVALAAFKQNPAPILPILENLKEDPSEYVRRSVANNLNDIAKDHPEVVLDTVGRWKSQSPETSWIIKHGCRTLLKKGNKAALLLHGFETKRRIVLEALKAGKKIRRGDYLHFSFGLRSMERARTRLRLEYRIDYLTSTGKISKKIFRIGEYYMDRDTPLFISRKQSFKDLSTRKHFAGPHHLHILINGQALSMTRFQVHD